ncbi:MAG: hypothetical protein M1837_001609 [Sclerophora amabilis]|nr:MAG: hypothetical protein M1837_001609 [Sclerophora amabilis]
MAKHTRNAIRNARRRKESRDDDVADIYKELLIEAAPSSSTHFDEDRRAFKRRRTRRPGERPQAKQDPDLGEVCDKIPSRKEDENQDHSTSDASDYVHAPSAGQTAFADSESSAGSDVDWEEVDLANAHGGDINAIEKDERDGKDMNVVLSRDKIDDEKARRPKRRPVTAAERRSRLEIHKMHILCLLAHVDMRNDWCNDFETQSTLRKSLTNRTVSYLNPDRGSSQFQRSRSFMDGLEQASEAWRSKFKKTARGLRRPVWACNPEELQNFRLPEDMSPPLDKTDFRKLALKPEISRDVGSQLFCSLLRSVGVNTRLVCSLQPLPFLVAAPKGSTIQGRRPEVTIDAPGNRGAASADDSGSKDESERTGNPSIPSDLSARPPLVPKRARRLGQPSFGIPSSIESGKQPQPQARKPKRIRESRYPVYWVEAFNEALQKWITVDPLVTETVYKPNKLEPPAAETENTMTYVVAFEEDGVVRDVTKRYAKAFNAKTRKARVESTKGGDKWWRKTLGIYSRGWDLDRDQVENTELASKEAQEPMPRNVQDFKDHPHYALERHLKKNEVVHPRNEVGKVATGKLSVSSGVKALEPIYRRRDVCTVRSADAWYRLGREVKPGEQPLKRAKPRINLNPNIEETTHTDSDEGEDAGTPLYATFQTTVYRAPRIVNGRVPKNSYGNLDIYVASMVPEGGVHILDRGASYAARLLGIDYADAVTGFDFKGRHGTAIIRGVIAATEYKEALDLVIQAMLDERASAEAAQKSLKCLRLWKRFLAALRIKQRIEEYDVEGEGQDVKGEMVSRDMDLAEFEGGGFIPESGEGALPEPTAGHFFARQRTEEEVDESGAERQGNVADELDEENSNNEETSQPQLPPYESSDVGHEDTVDVGGGFLPELGEDDRGGFLLQHDPAGNEPRDDDRPDETGNFEHELSDEDLVLQDAILQSAKVSNSSNPTKLLMPDHAGQDLWECQSNPDSGSKTDSTAASQKSNIRHQTPPEWVMKDRPSAVRSDSRELGTPKARDDPAPSGVGGPPKDESEGNGNLSDDRGSLMSHDPDDEDAEPEWLA